MDVWNENVWLAARGGGIGTYWGNVRSIGEKVKGSGKTYSPEELVKKKQEIDAMNQEISSLIRKIPDFTTMEDAKNKINSFLK